MTTELEPLLSEALDHHRAGRLPEAETLYRRLLAADPRHADALHLLGLIAHQVGRAEAAIELIGQAAAIAPSAAYCSNLGAVLMGAGRPAEALDALDAALRLQPGSPGALCNRANALRALGRQDEALAGYEAAIAASPDHAEAHYNLGVLRSELGLAEEAAEAFEAAIRLGARHAGAYFNLAGALQKLGRLEEAVAAYDGAIELEPERVEAHVNRGAALADLGRKQEAIAAYDRALALAPHIAAAHTNRGNALFDLGRLDEALEAHETALGLQPDLVMAHYNRGNTLRALDRSDEALAAYDAALALDPNLAAVHSNRGAVLSELGRIEEAAEAFSDAVRLKPDYAEANYNLAFAHFLLERWREGWRQYEWRWRGGLPTLRPRGFSRPQWSGEDPAGRVVLLHAEQGLGDTLQFCRYAPLLAALGARVVLEAPRSMVRLLSTLPGVERLVVAGDPLPDFDLHCPLMSLPGVFGTTPETVPAEAAYLSAEPEAVERWRARIGPEGFRIGIAWQGNPTATAEKGRSAPLAGFAALARDSRVRLISLQKGPGLDQLASLPDGMKVETLGEEFDSGPDAFVDTAAVMESLDLVITVDTAVGHLAGALGRPTWLMLQKVPHWVWTLRGETTPWYPRHRLFRQDARGDWAGVFARMAAALAARA